MVNLLRALHFRRVVGKVLVDSEREVENPAFVHALVRLDCECEVEDVVGVGEVGPHGGAEGKFGEICKAQCSVDYLTSLFCVRGDTYLFELVIGQL